MERVQTLIEKLQHQVDAKVSENEMLITTQLLYTELNLKKGSASEIKNEGPYVIPSIPIPVFDVPQTLYNKKSEAEQPVGEKTTEVLEVDEKEIEEELNQIKKNAEIKNTLSANARPEIVEEVKEAEPERSHPSFNIYADKTEIPISLNESLKEHKTELSEKLVDTPIKDLKKAIGVNDRYVFINELFNGDEAMYERSLKTINGFSIYPEAEYWIRRELKLKLGWKDSSENVKQFDQLVRRRFL